MEVLLYTRWCQHQWSECQKHFKAFFVFPGEVFGPCISLTCVCIKLNLWKALKCCPGARPGSCCRDSSSKILHLCREFNLAQLNGLRLTLRKEQHMTEVFHLLLSCTTFTTKRWFQPPWLNPHWLIFMSKNARNSVQPSRKLQTVTGFQQLRSLLKVLKWN